jgi:DNA-binding ferritin-like protein
MIANMTEIAAFVLALLHSSTNAHLMHWSTKSLSVHLALGDYYAKIIELADQFAEAAMGRYEQLKEFPSDYHQATEPVAYLESMKSFVEEARQHLPQDSELQNLVDEIADLINSTLFKLRFLD